METTLIFSGIAVSLIVQLIKNKFNLSTLGTMLVVMTLSLIGATGYFLLQKFGMLDSFIQIITVAGAFYAFIIKNMKDSSNE